MSLRVALSVRSPLAGALGIALMVLLLTAPLVRAQDEEVDGGTGSVEALGWTDPAVLEGLGDGLIVEHIAGAEDGLRAIAAGPSSDAKAGTSPRIWTSLDGGEWVTSEPPGSGNLTDLAAGPTGVIALVGNAMMGDDARVFHSASGEAWTEVSLPADDGSSVLLTDISATPAGFVAAGATGGDGLGPTPAVWSSPDGLVWQRETLDADSYGLAHGVAAGPGGRLLVVGVASPEPLTLGSLPGGWIRGDSGAWNELGPLVDAPWSLLAPPRFLGWAAGRYFTVVSRQVLTSVDGVTWEPGPILPGYLYNQAMTPFRGGVLMTRDPDDPRSSTELSWSPDWIMWTKLPIKGFKAGAVSTLGTFEDGSAVLATYESKGKGKKQRHLSQVRIGADG